jgi:WXG100 family type VII secretion target
VDLPGRPSGNADTLHAAARTWDHLASEIWQLRRVLEAEVDALALAWSGAAADAYAEAWQPVRRGFDELEAKIHGVARRLRTAGGMIEDGQAAYDRALAAAGVVAAAGIGLTLLSGGLSDVAGAAAEGEIAATATAIVSDLGLGMARVAELLAKTMEELSGLASRFAVNFAVRAPELAYGPAGGGAMGIGFALASGVRDPGDLAASGLLGAAENAGGGRRGGGAAAEEDEFGAPPGARAGAMRPMHPIEQAWSASLSPRQAARQALNDERAAERAADPSLIKEPLTASTVREISVKAPGSVWYVDRELINRASANLDALTDVDVETRSVAIQVKSGGTGDLSKQMARTQATIGKTVVALAPKMTDVRLAWYRQHGYTVFRDLDDLLEYLRHNP